MSTQRENRHNMLQQQKQASLTKSSNASSESGGPKTGFSFNLRCDSRADAVLRQPRSQAFLDAVAMIDLLSSADEDIIEKLKETVDEDTLEEFTAMTPEELYEEIMISFREEMEEREKKLEQLEVKPEELEAVISRCYIHGCDVHAIDRSGHILEHFKTREKLPGNLEKGRELYHKNKKCNCVEVYSNCCRIIQPDGSVVTVNN